MTDSVIQNLQSRGTQHFEYIYFECCYNGRGPIRGALGFLEMFSQREKFETQTVLEFLSGILKINT